MKSKLAYKKMKTKPKRVSYMNVVRRTIGWFYSFLESFFRPGWVTRRRIKRGKIKIPFDIYRMNKIMRRFYRRPEMQILDATGLEECTFEANDGRKIAGVKFKCNPDSNKWVVACHWFGGHKYWALYHAIIFRKMGYNILAFDFRGHGKSEKDTTTMGAKEVFDLMGAIKYLNETEEVEHIAAYGISMGAFCVSYLSVYDPEFAKKYKVKYGICDSDYESVLSLMYHVRNIYLRAVPKRKIKARAIKFLQHHNSVEAKNNIDLFATSVIGQIAIEKHKPAYPILFMHSQNDKVTSPIDSYRSFSARAGKISGDEIWTFQYGTHALMVKEHFKDVLIHMGEYIAKQDNNQKGYENASNELRLTIREPIDEKQHNLI